MLPLVERLKARDASTHEKLDCDGLWQRGIVFRPWVTPFGERSLLETLDVDNASDL